MFFLGNEGPACLSAGLTERLGRAGASGAPKVD